MPKERAETTEILARASRGDSEAISTFLPLVYDELRALAARYLARERAEHTLQPTALVHEAFLRLVDASGAEPVDEAHFVALAAGAMRRALVDHARARGADKRGGGARRITLSTSAAEIDEAPLDLLALDEAFEKLARLDERQARVVELRFFGGLSVDECARVLGLSKRSIETDWSLARAFLRRELVGDAE